MGASEIRDIQEDGARTAKVSLFLPIVEDESIVLS